MSEFRLTKDESISILFGVVLGGLLTVAIQRYITEPKKEAPPLELVPIEERKMVFCVNMSLKMKAGKIGAQVGHATLGAYKKAKVSAPGDLRCWLDGDQVKITLRVQNLEEMVDLIEKCRSAGIVTYCVADAGRTQIPKGSRTVLAIGPAPVSKIDAITRHLKLYN